MDSFRLNNAYALLAAFLSPVKGAEQIEALRQLIVKGQIVWPDLVYRANLQLCTPLWYVQLQRDGLLQLLPQDLQEYLQQLHQANVERNAEMRHGLEELLQAFAREDIDPLLLKGAATFCDDLYGDSGARVMGDLDILVEPHQVEQARQILLKLGYQKIPDPGMDFDGLATDERRHQLPRHFKPGTPVVIEIHFKISYGQSGRVLPVVTARENVLEIGLAGASATLFNPTWRLLHNTVHALLPHCEFIRGDISLLQLAEFVQLAKRYGQQIDWDEWLALAQAHKLTTEFSVYQQLARELMFLHSTNTELPAISVKLHKRRILNMGARLGVQGKPGRSVLATIYYYFNLPAWVWRNICYIEGSRNIPRRLIYMLKKGLSARSRAKIGM